MAEEARHVTVDPTIPNEEEIVSEILENLPTDVDFPVDLPSKGRYYNEEGSQAPVLVRAMTFEDEKVLSKMKDRLDGVNVLLARCVKNLDVRQILLFDKIYLLLKIREMSFGPEVAAIAMCTQCGSENTLTLDIPSFKVNEVPEDVTDPRDVLLPTLKKSATVRFPRVSDEANLMNTDRLLDNVWRFVVAIDGNSSKSIISKVIQKLPAKDTNILIQSIFGTDYGIETKGQYECDMCGAVNTTEVSVTDDFFGQNSNPY